MLRIPADLAATRILVTNDDGIHAPGIGVLAEVARALSKDVWVVAPEVEQSGAAHSLTLHQPLRVRKITGRRYAVSGTPTDCVLLGAREIIPARKPVGLVLSGVNAGSNVAEDVTYSGTIAAAMESALLGIPSIAFSMERPKSEPMLWKTATHFIPKILESLEGFRWPEGNLLSVNLPALPVRKVKGVRLARQGMRAIPDKIDGRLDPKGRPYYWIGSPDEDAEDAPGTDFTSLKEGYITITPLTMDLTNLAMLRALEGHLGKQEHGKGQEKQK